MKNITEWNELIYTRAKLLCEKNEGSPKKHEKKFKTWMKNSIGNADKISTTTSKNDFFHAATL